MSQADMLPLRENETFTDDGREGILLPARVQDGQNRRSSKSLRIRHIVLSLFRRRLAFLQHEQARRSVWADSASGSMPSGSRWLLVDGCLSWALEFKQEISAKFVRRDYGVRRLRQVIDRVFDLNGLL